MTIRALPVSPSRDRPAQFSQEMDAMLAALPDFVSDANALEQSLQLVATTGTSASTLTIGTGTKTLTTQPGKAWVTGAWVYVFCASAVTNLMVGQVTSYNAATGVLQINSQQVDGGGTFSSWVIGLSVPQVAWAEPGVNNDITALDALSETPDVVQAAIDAAGGIVGASRGARMYVQTASAAATFSADELFVVNSAGAALKISGLSLSINLITTGAGGMHVGQAPVSGFVAVYVIYNRVTAQARLLGVDATAAAAPQAYSGTNMPDGYTHSALVAVLPTDSARRFARLAMIDRRVYIDSTNVLANGSASTNTAVSVASVIPPSARCVCGLLGKGATGSNASIYADAGGLLSHRWTGVVNVQGLNTSFSDLPIVVPQTIYYSTDGTANVWLTGYEF